MVLFLILFLGLSSSFVWTVYKETKRRNMICEKFEEIKENYDKGFNILYPLLSSLATETAKLGWWSKDKLKEVQEINLKIIEIIELFVKNGNKQGALYAIDKLKKFYIHG